MNNKIEQTDNAIQVALLMQSGEAGGVQRVMINLAKGLQALGVKICFLIGDAQGDMIREMPSGCDIIDFKRTKCRGDSKLFVSLLAIRKFMRTHPDTILIGAPGLAGTALAFIKFLGGKNKAIAIVDNRCSLLKDGTVYHTAVYYINKLLFRFLNGVVAAHTAAFDEQAKFYHIKKKNLYKIYHPLVDPLKIINACPIIEHKFIRDKKDGAQLLLAAGRLVPEKDFSTLLKAFDIVRAQKNIRLIVLGDGPLKNALANQLSQSRYPEDVDLFGYTDNVLGFMKSVDLFVLSSQKEAFGNVLIEALSCGIPCVATDCDSKGPRDIMDGGNPSYGVLCPPNNPIELAKAIDIATEISYDSRVLKKRAEIFTIGHSARHYLRTIKEISK